MAFEISSVPEIVPDEEQAKIWGRVKKYFEEVLNGVEESSQGGKEDDEESAALQAVLDAIESNDYDPAFQYLEKEIARLKTRITQISVSEIGREVTAPQLETRIGELEELKDSLLLSEK